MVLKSRKFYVWLISLLVILVVYGLYSLSSETPEIKIDTPKDSGAPSGEFGGKVGRVGVVGVGTVKELTFKRFNEDKTVVWEFGFEVLLHEEGSEWEIDRPFMNIFRPDLKCRITADRGTVQVEEAGGGFRPKDGTLTGNVVIHVLPERGSGIQESFVYLDDVLFMSEMSLFSTAGSVKFISEDAQLLGRGMEFVYNAEKGRLEFLKISHLDSLRIRQRAQAGLFLSGAGRIDDSAEASGDRLPSVFTADESAQRLGASREQDDDNYSCVFRKNVIIDTPEQLVFADEVSINDIVFSTGSGGKVAAAEGAGAGYAKAARVDFAGQNEPLQLFEQADDILVTCGGGIVVEPMNTSARAGNVKPAAAATERQGAENFDDVRGRTTFVARRVDYYVSDGDSFAAGPIELTFYANGTMGPDANERIIPVKITAQEQARFLPKSNRVIFEGDCLCTMPREELGDEYQYSLSTPKLTVKLSAAESTWPGGLAAEPTVSAFSSNGTFAAESQTPGPSKTPPGKRPLFMADLNRIIFEGDNLCLVPREILGSEFFLPPLSLAGGSLSADSGRRDGGLSSVGVDSFIAAGPVELSFYANDITARETPAATVLPVSVTAEREARFVPSLNKVVFEDKCVCRMVNEDEHTRAEYTLSAPQLTIDLADSGDKPSSASDMAAGIKHLTAGGGLVRLAAVKTAGKQLIDGVELKCSRFDFDADMQMFLAAGPGIIKGKNSGITLAEAGSEKSGSLKEFYALIQNFETLRYYLESNRILADSKLGRVRIDYFPIVNGKYDQQVTVSAGHMEVRLLETDSGETEISTISADSGISYSDRDKQFEGGRMFYDAGKSEVLIQADQAQPCLLNGVPVAGIKYNLKTGKLIKAKIVGPGLFQIKR